MPVLVNEKRQKLSKRRDKVALEAYRDEGYLADAMRNYLMLLGWAPSGDREIVPWSVIEDEFRLEDVNPSPAFFDVKKLRAFNGEYIRALTVGRVHRGVRSRGWSAGRGRDESGSAPPWPAATRSTRRCSRRSRRSRRPASRVLVEIVPNVDFLFLDEPADRRGVLGQGDEGAARRTCWPRPSPRSRRCRRGRPSR